MMICPLLSTSTTSYQIKTFFFHPKQSYCCFIEPTQAEREEIVRETKTYIFILFLHGVMAGGRANAILLL